MTVQPRRRTMNPAAKRDAILSAAADLLGRNGYDGTSIAAVAAGANVAVGSVYRLFKDKHALLAAVHSVVEDAFIEAIEQGWARGGALEHRMSAIAENLFDTALDLQGIVSVLAEQRGGGKDLTGTSVRIVDAIEMVIMQGVEEGIVPAQPLRPKAEIAHGVVVGAMTGCFMRGPVGDVPSYVTLVARTLTVLLKV